MLRVMEKSRRFDKIGASLQFYTTYYDGCYPVGSFYIRSKCCQIAGLLNWK